ncbi:MAG: S6e family ribosomal protein [Sulfolobales archaeon]
MPDLKVVISDPAVKENKWVKVIFIGDPSLPYGEEEKSGRRIIRAKISETLHSVINPELGIVNARVWKSSTEKVNFQLQISVDKSLEGVYVVIPAGFMREKFGAERVFGEIKKASSFQITLPSDRAQKLYGYKIGDVIEGGLVGLPGYYLEIRGGSDYAGTPMLPTLPGPGKRYLLLSEPPGFRPVEKGLRKRKLVRGNTISETTTQINTIIIRRELKKE